MSQNRESDQGMENAKNPHVDYLGVVHESAELELVSAGEENTSPTTGMNCTVPALRIVEIVEVPADPFPARSLGEDVGTRAIRMHPCDRALMTKAHERDLQQFAQRQLTTESADPATWQSSREAALFRMTIAVPGQHAGILETAYYAIVAFIARARTRSASRPRREVAIKVFTGDGA
jgi:hypothetical protein